MQWCIVRGALSPCSVPRTLYCYIATCTLSVTEWLFSRLRWFMRCARVQHLSNLGLLHVNNQQAAAPYRHIMQNTWNFVNDRCVYGMYTMTDVRIAVHCTS